MTPPSFPSDSESSNQCIELDLQDTFAKKVLLSGTWWISSPSPDDSFSAGFVFSSPSFVESDFDSASPLDGEDASLDSSSLTGLSLSASVFTDSSTGLLGAATMVLASTVSTALNTQYTVHQGSCRCRCRSLQNDRVRLVRLQAAQIRSCCLSGN